jgi:hypothetical protein
LKDNCGCRTAEELLSSSARGRRKGPEETIRSLRGVVIFLSNNIPDHKSQSFVPFPGVLTSSTQSLTWRDLLIGLATYYCDQFQHSEETIARLSNAQSMETNSHG